MYLNVKIKTIFCAILVFGITINTLNSAAKKKEDPKSKKEEKIYEKLKGTGIFPEELSSIIASYAAPKQILLNFLIPNLKGNLQVSYSYTTSDEKVLDKMLKKYPKLKSDKKLTRRGFDYIYEPIADQTEADKAFMRPRKDFFILEKIESMPLASKMAIPIFKKIENFLLKPEVRATLKIGDKGIEKEYTYSLLDPYYMSKKEKLKSIGTLGGKLSIKLIDALKKECEGDSEAIIPNSHFSLYEYVPISPNDPKVCVKILS